jgi:beta-lactamase regulating signal transducer with metallopeptidase domain/N-acetylneuraminic acid mutarotase
MEGLPALALNSAHWLLRVSLQSAVLIVLVLLVQWAFRRWMSPACRHALWLLVVARLILPLSLESRFSMFNWLNVALASPSNPPSLAAPVMLTTPVLRALSEAGSKPMEPTALPPAAATTSAPAKGELVVAWPGEPTVANPSWVAATRRPAFWLMVGWWAGVLALSGRVLAQTVRLRRSVVPKRLVTNSAVLELLEDCKQIMRVQVPIVLVQTDRVSSPVLFGFIRPRLLLPAGLLERFSRAELRFVFLHELAHIQRRDIALSWLMAILQILHWFNPFVWIAFARMKADRELACDALALSRTEEGQHLAYGRTMLRLLEGFVRATPLPSLAGILEDSSQLKARIRSIATFDGRSPSPALAVGVAVILALVGLTDQRAQGSAPARSIWSAHLISKRSDGDTDIRCVTLRTEEGINIQQALARGELQLAAPIDSTHWLEDGYRRIGTVEGLAMDCWRRGATSGAPSPRTAHSVVWTGHELVVWGGGARNSFKQSGGRYDPFTDTWRPISTNGAPQGRWHHAAAWTGTEMIVWGGRGNFFARNNQGDGARYDPKTDIWKPMNAQGAPAPRSQMAAVWTGREFIVWGGRGDDETVFRDGARYNPETDTWAPVANCPDLEARFAATAIWSGSEMIVWGGTFWEQETLRSRNTGARYDPRQDRWTVLPQEGAPCPRSRHTAVWTGTEMIVWGGTDYSGMEFFNDGGRFDPSTGRWKSTSLIAAPDKRSHHLAIWDGTRMMVWGGIAEGSDCFNTGATYDPRLDRWSPLTMAGAPAPRYLMRPDSAVWTGQQLLLYGGYDLNREFGSTHRWSPAPPMTLYQRVR